MYVHNGTGAFYISHSDIKPYEEIDGHLSHEGDSASDNVDELKLGKDTKSEYNNSPWPFL